MSMNRKSILLDSLIILASISAVIFSFFHAKSGKNENLSLIINSEEGEYIYPLSENASYSAQGTLGVSKIVVENGEAYFEDSPCPNKTCVDSGKISHSGEWAACLPNNVFIRVEGSAKNGSDSLDAISE